MNSVSIFTRASVVILLMLIQEIFATHISCFGGLTSRSLSFSLLCELTVSSGCGTVTFVSPKSCLLRLIVALRAVAQELCGPSISPPAAVVISHNDVLTESICRQVFSCCSIPRLPVGVPWVCASPLSRPEYAMFFYLPPTYHWVPHSYPAVVSGWQRCLALL